MQHDGWAKKRKLFRQNLNAAATDFNTTRVGAQLKIDSSMTGIFPLLCSPSFIRLFPAQPTSSLTHTSHSAFDPTSVKYINEFRFQANKFSPINSSTDLLNVKHRFRFSLIQRIQCRCQCDKDETFPLIPSLNQVKMSENRQRQKTTKQTFVCVRDKLIKRCQNWLGI